MSASTALVTGATGCLGRHVVARLLAGGYRVRASGRNSETGAALSRSGAEVVSGDLRTPGIAERLAAGADVIFHCAALSAPWGRRQDFHANNVEATRALLEAARRAGVRRFVHVSSPSIYFQFQDAIGIREDAALPRRFVNAYAASKAEAEAAVLHAGRNGLGYAILRPRGIFGEHDTALAPRLLRLAASGRVPLLRGGCAVVDVTYAGNVAEAMLLAAAPAAPNGVFNITNGEPLEVRDLLARMFAALDLEVRLVEMPYHMLYGAAMLSEAAAVLLRRREPRLLRYTLGVMAYSQTLDIGVARAQLGYAPRVSINEALARYARWLRSAAGGQDHAIDRMAA